MNYRPLTPAELATYARLADLLTPDEAEIFREQLAAATVCDEDDGQHGSFAMTVPVRRLFSRRSQALSGTYADADGWPIDLIMHSSAGLLSYVERYRTDAGAIIDKRPPLPANLRLSPTEQ